MRDVFLELGSVDAEHADAADPADRGRRPRKAGRARRPHAWELRAPARPQRTEVVVFASAHAQAGALHLVGTRLPVQDLRALVQATGADLRLVIVDACETGEAQKGATRGPAYALTVEAPPTTGDVFIASSGAHEPAQEWDALGGSLFTHHLLAGLRGDADFDRDGRVTLMEAFAYAELRGPSLTRSIPASIPSSRLGSHRPARRRADRPAARARARVVLKESLQPAASSSPACRGRRSSSRRSRRRGRPLVLAVPAGRYLLRQTGGFRVATEELELPVRRDCRGGRQTLRGARLCRGGHEGGGAGVPPQRAPRGGRPRDARRRGNGSAVDPGGRLPARARILVGSARAGRGLRTASRRKDWPPAQWRFAARASAGPRFWVGPVTVIPAAGLELSLLRQSYVRDQEAVIVQSYPVLPARDTAGFAFGPQLWAEVPLTGPLFASLAGMLWVRALPALAQSAWSVAPEAEAALGVRFWRPAFTALAFSLVACGQATGTSYQGLPLFQVTGTMVAPAGPPSLPIRLAVAWYPDQGTLAGPEAIVTQDVNYVGSFPLDYMPSRSTARRPLRRSSPSPLTAGPTGWRGASSSPTRTSTAMAGWTSSRTAAPPSITSWGRAWATSTTGARPRSRPTSPTSTARSRPTGPASRTATTSTRARRSSPRPRRSSSTSSARTSSTSSSAPPSSSASSTRRSRAGSHPPAACGPSARWPSSTARPRRTSASPTGLQSRVPDATVAVNGTGLQYVASDQDFELAGAGLSFSAGAVNEVTVVPDGGSPRVFQITTAGEFTLQGPALDTRLVGGTPVEVTWTAAAGALETTKPTWTARPPRGPSTPSRWCSPVRPTFAAELVRADGGHLRTR